MKLDVAVKIAVIVLGLSVASYFFFSIGDSENTTKWKTEAGQWKAHYIEQRALASKAVNLENRCVTQWLGHPRPVEEDK